MLGGTKEVYVAPPEAAVPPLWLPKKLHKEFREIGEILLAAGLYPNWTGMCWGSTSWPGSGGSGGQAGIPGHPR